MRRLTMRTVAIAALVLSPSLALAQAGGGQGGGDRGGPDQGGPKMGQDRDHDGGRMRGGDAGDHGGDRQDRMRSDNGRPDGPGEKRRDDRAMGQDRRGDNRVGGHPGEMRAARITTEQRTQIRSRFRGLGGERLRGSEFAVNVGTVVPPRYRFNRLPPEIVDIVPEYRDYDYILVGDQVLIIDPDTRQIVSVLD